MAIPIFACIAALLNMNEETLISHIEHLRETYKSGRTQPLEWRRKQLRSLKRMFDERSLDFENALHKDLRKSPVESYLTEIGLLSLEIDHALRELEDWSRPLEVSTPVFLQPAISRVIFEPIGVVLIIGAWKY